MLCFYSLFGSLFSVFEAIPNGFGNADGFGLENALNPPVWSNKGFPERFPAKFEDPPKGFSELEGKADPSIFFFGSLGY